MNGVDVVVRYDAFPLVQALAEHVPVNVLTVGLQSGAHLVGVDREVFAVDLVQDRFVDEFLPDDFQRGCGHMRPTSSSVHQC